jgi:polar amino acid transport system permease protein
MFLAITVPLTRVTDHLAARSARRRGGAGAGVAAGNGNVR